MSLRSSKQLQTEISLREHIEELSRATAEEEDPWSTYAAQSNRRELMRAKTDLAQVEGGLEWAFEGTGVRGQVMAMNRLAPLIADLGQTLRWTARDILVDEGAPLGIVERKEVVEPAVAGTFGGSFGIRIVASPTIEQMTLAGTLFDRAATRVVDIFESAHADEPEPAITEAIAGLRQRTIDGLKKLSSQLAEAGKPSRIRWQGRTIVTVTTSDATLLNEAISGVTVVEETVEVIGELVGGDYKAGQFHIEVAGDPEPKVYRGKTEEGDVRTHLKGLELGTMVKVTLDVVETHSRFFEIPRETYVLRRVEPLPRRSS